jgi:serine/threonine protein kinase
MKVENFKDGDVMYSYGDVGRRILMIELGEAVICFPDHKIAERELDSIGLDHLLGVERPEGLFLRAVRDMNTHQLCQFLRHADVDTPAVSEQIPTDPYREPEQPNTCALTAGCILGIGAIRGKARLNTDGFWTWLPDRFTDETYHGRTTYDGRSISGAKYPYTVVAKGDVQCLTFSVDTLTSLFGPPEELVTTAMNVMKENYLYDKEKFTSPSKAPHWKELDSLGEVDTTDSLSIDSEIKADSKLEINLHGREELKQRKGDPEQSSYTDGVTLMTPTRNCDLDEFPDKKPTFGRKNNDCVKNLAHEFVGAIIDDKKAEISETESDLALKPTDMEIDGKFSTSNNDYVDSCEVYLARSKPTSSFHAALVHENRARLRIPSTVVLEDDDRCVIKVGSMKSPFFRNELRTLKKLSTLNPFIVRCFGACCVPNRPQTQALVLEYLECVDLWTCIHDQPGSKNMPAKTPVSETGSGMTWGSFVIASLIFAVRQIHMAGLTYRNLLPENVLFDCKGRLRLVDFSLSCSVENPAFYLRRAKNTGDILSNDISSERPISNAYTYTLCGCAEYMAPEMVLGEGHDQGIDLWALGILLHEFFLGHTPFCVPGEDSANTAEIMTKIIKLKRGDRCDFIPSDPFESDSDALLVHEMITKLLSPCIIDRPGYFSSLTKLLQCRMFDYMEVDLLETNSLEPPYKPPVFQPTQHDESQKQLLWSNF